MGLSRGTHTFRGINLRLDQIKIIDPIITKTSNLDGGYGLFMRTKKLNMRSQYHFTIWFINKGGYRDFYSKTVDFVGTENFKSDVNFLDEYNNLVKRWEIYHDK